jgi:uncharacterized protein (DUF697 family)
MSDKEVTAQEIVKKHSMYAAGAGLIPFPVVDFAAITALQLKMLRDLGKVYDQPFEKDKVKPIVGALIGGYSSTKIGYGVGGSLMKSVPVLGQAFGLVSVPAFAAALTWAVGKVFIMHFASGGTFLDFNPDKMREHFAKAAEEGRTAAA